MSVKTRSVKAHLYYDLVIEMNIIEKIKVMKIEVGHELVATKNIYEYSGGYGDILAAKGDSLIIESILDDPDDEDFGVTVSLKHFSHVSPFVVRCDEVQRVKQ